MIFRGGRCELDDVSSFGKTVAGCSKGWKKVWLIFLTLIVWAEASEASIAMPIGRGFFPHNTPGVRCRYDARNRLVWMADGWSTNSYSYDPASRLTNMVEVRGASTQQWSYAFDALDRLTGMVWQISGNTNKFTTFYQYDTLDRVTNILAMPGAFGVVYTNEGLQVSRITYPNGQAVARQYDALGRLTNHTHAGGTWSYAFDSRDQIIRCVDPSNNVFAYQYDDQGRLIEATGLRGTNALSMYPQRFNYDRVGNRTHSTVGKQQHSYSYNNNNQLLSYERPKSTLIRGYVNEPSTVAVRSNTATNWLAASTRFISATQVYYEASVAITNWGTNNYVWIRATDTSGNVSTSRVRVTSYWNSSSFSYDADGNQVRTLIATNTFDALNRILRFQDSSGYSIFQYDGAGRLREVREYTSGGVLWSFVRYAWQGWMPFAELDSLNRPIRFFVWGPDRSGTIGGAGGIGGILAAWHTNGVSYYYRGDGLGNVTEVAQTNGALVRSLSYAPFGRITTNSGTYSQLFAYQTKLFHVRSGFVYFGHRWLELNTGRWLSRDPLGEGESINLYSFCLADPINNFDPDGLRVRLNGTAQEQAQLLGSLQNFVRGTLLIDSDGFVSRVPCNQDERYEALIDELIKSDNLYHIEFGDASLYGGGSFSPGGFRDGGLVTLSRDIGGSYTGWKGWNIVSDTRTTASVLAHELGHAITHVKRIRNADQRLPSGDSRKKKLEDKAWKYSETPYERLNKAVPAK